MAAGTDITHASATEQPGRPAADRPLRIRRITAEGMLTIGGSAAAALALDWVLYERVLPFSGVLGFWICWYALFLICYTSVAAFQWDGLAVRDKVISVTLATSGIPATALVIDQVAYTLVRGSTVVEHLSFFTQSMVSTGPLSPLTSGGVGRALVGTIEQITIATVLSVPLGIAAASTWPRSAGGARHRCARWSTP
jgi:phosphate transport system permease protein